MYILGLHFGHDASVSIIKNGEILVCLERERKTRLRHAIGLTSADISDALIAAGCELNEIDFCSVTSTQNIEYIFSQPSDLTFDIDLKSKYLNNNHWANGLKLTDIEDRFHKRVLNLVSEGQNHAYVKRLSSDLKGSDPTVSLGSIEDFYTSSAWLQGAKLNEMTRLVSKEPITREMSQSMQLPILLNLMGRQIPGWIMSHHFAHAAYAFYTSGYHRAAIITQDGSLPRGGYWNGMCYFGAGNSIYPIMPHHLSAGRMYEAVSVLLGFGVEEGPGKMMGLAPFGKPVFFDKKFVGNIHDIADLVKSKSRATFPNWSPDRFDVFSNAWIRHCAEISTNLGYDFSPLGDTDRILEPICVDIAASTQLLLEEIMVRAVDEMQKTYKTVGIDPEGNLCLSGGTALNCPSNSKIYNSKLFDNLFVPPAIHDGGLSTGSALAIYHNTLNKDRTVKYGLTPKLAYLGVQHDIEKIQQAFDNFNAVIKVSHPSDVAKAIAQRLAKNEIVAVMVGRSEVGPRALGHRSILAHAGYQENWKKVNDIKKREYWRPFAPAVLESKASEWFSGVPEQSPFMLLTARVLKTDIPAVTHVDGSARIQTVNEDAPELMAILIEFERLTGIPILMNTSLNGPGEPIIETAQQALSFFVKSDLDALFIEGYEVVRK